MKKKLISFGLLVSSMFLLVAFAAPSFVAAQATSCDELQDFDRLLCKVATILNNVIPVLITLAVVYFIWGVIHYGIARDEDAKTEGRGAMIQGLIALLVIVSVWGLVNFMKSFIGINLEDSEITIPCIPSNGVPCPQNE